MKLEWPPKHILLVCCLVGFCNNFHLDFIILEPQAATSGGRKLLHGGDTVSDQLLSYVSGHVFSSRRHQFATHALELKETLYQNIERDARSESERNAAVRDHLQ